MSNFSQPDNLASQWLAARQIHTLYTGLAHEFVIDLPVCREFESNPEEPSEEVLEAFREWFLEVDQRIQVFQLRQFLQNSQLAGNSGLRALLKYHLSKPTRNDSDRDKIDFLLVQFFSNCVPTHIKDDEVEPAYVAETLHPVLGDTYHVTPEWLASLEGLVVTARQCATLADLFKSGILEKGRKLKTSVADRYFVPSSMVAFTRFNFVLRRIFFRLLHEDLNAIFEGLRELEQRGATTLDCRRAQFSGEEPLSRLRMICQSWKVMFQAEYSSGQPLRMLVDLRNVIETAVGTASGQAPRAKAAAASAASAAVAQLPEFEVSTSPRDHGQEDSAGS